MKHLPVIVFGVGFLLFLVVPGLAALDATLNGDGGGLLFIPFCGVLLLLAAIIVASKLPAMSDAEFIRREQIADAEHQARLRELERR